MPRGPLLLATLLLLVPACDDSDGGPDDATAGTTGDAGTGDSSDPSGTPGSGTTSTTGAGATSDEPAGSSSSDATSSSDPSGDASSSGFGSESSTGEPPTSGPGVLPGETGLDAFCRRYFECGGSFYADQDDCIDASVGYWGECAEVTEALDAFGACMADVACEDYNPDAYNPANTVCSEQWGEVGQAGPC